MKPAPFTYHRPAEVAEAVQLLARLHEQGEHAKVLAGGQSLLPMLSMRLASPAHLVDVNALPGLATIDVDTGGVRIGALVRHRALERHQGAYDAVPLLRQALEHVAHPTIRNRGTTVGSLCHADPSAEMPAVLALLGGSLVVRSVRGERSIAASELFVGPLETSMADDELAVGAVFAAPGARTGTAVAELARRHGDYAMCGVVAAVTLDGDGRVERARVTYVSAGESISPVDLTETVGDAAPDWAAGGELARTTVETETDIHGTAEYRSQLVAVLTERALSQAAARARTTSEEAA